MNGFKIAAIMLLAYVVLLFCNGMFYYSWSGDASEIPRLLIRCVGVSAVAYGLWKAQRWAWRVGLVISIFFASAGVLSLVLFFPSAVADLRPYPVIDYLFFLVATILLIGTFVVLLLQKTRSAIGAGTGVKPSDS